MGVSDGDDVDAGNDDDDDEDTLSFACFICRNPFVDLVVTKCKHYFCEHCALKHHSRNKNCYVCNQLMFVLLVEARRKSVAAPLLDANRRLSSPPQGSSVVNGCLLASHISSGVVDVGSTRAATSPREKGKDEREGAKKREGERKESSGRNLGFYSATDLHRSATVCR
ncbi:hypothetical protein Droror1_Dr00025702 [Drosera rotundifolia]